METVDAVGEIQIEPRKGRLDVLEKNVDIYHLGGGNGLRVGARECTGVFHTK